jgi:hypothetical protein
MLFRQTYVASLTNMHWTIDKRMFLFQPMFVDHWTNFCGYLHALSTNIRRNIDKRMSNDRQIYVVLSTNVCRSLYKLLWLFTRTFCRYSDRMVRHKCRWKIDDRILIDRVTCVWRQNQVDAFIGSSTFLQHKCVDKLLENGSNVLVWSKENHSHFGNLKDR